LPGNSKKAFEGSLSRTNPKVLLAQLAEEDYFSFLVFSFLFSLSLFLDKIKVLQSANLDLLPQAGKKAGRV
jgi:hypothetical protein